MITSVLLYNFALQNLDSERSLQSPFHIFSSTLLYVTIGTDCGHAAGIRKGRIKTRKCRVLFEDNK